MDVSDSSNYEALKGKLKEVKKGKVQNDLIDFELTPGMIQEMMNKHQNFYRAMNTFEFNLFDFTEVVGRKMQMPFMAMALLQ